MRHNHPTFLRAIHLPLCRLASALLLGTPAAALAAPTVTNWTGTTDSHWTTPANWDNGIPATGYQATFNSAGNGNTTIDLGGASQPLNTLTFTGSPASYTIGANPADALTFDSAGAITVATGVTTSQTIAASIVTSGLSISNVAAGTTLTLAGSISGSGGVTTPAGGGGTILFAGNNSYSGNTTLSSNNTATIQIGSDTAFGTGTLVTNNTSNSPLQAVGGNRTLANPITLTFGFTVSNAATPNNLTLTGPLSLGSTGRTLTFNNYGQVATLGSPSSPSTITLSSAGNQNLAFNPSNNGTAAATLIINDVIRDNPTPPATPNTVSYNSVGNNTPEGNLIINGANTYAGSTTFNNQTSGTMIAMSVYLGVSSVGNPGSITSGPFGKGTLTPNNSNAPPIFIPFGDDRTIANAMNLTSGFFVASAPTTGTSPTTDPAGTTHNLTFTGNITDTGKVITNNMAPGVALYLGSAASPSTITMTNTTKIQSQSATPGSGTTIINDQLTGTGALTIQVHGTVQLANSTNNYSGATTVDAATLQLGADNGVSTASTLAINNSGTLDLNAHNQTSPSLAGSGGTVLLSGTLSLTGSTNTSFSGSVVGAGALSKDGPATQTLASVDAGSVTINAGRLVLSGTAASRISTLTASSAPLQINAPLVLPTMSQTDATTLVHAGRSGATGAWDGTTGITTTADAHHGIAITSVSSLGTAAFPNFPGLTGSETLLIPGTFYGDLNLDGKVNADDYTLMDRGAAKHLAGWANGDLNYDGTIDAADYLLIDSTYLAAGVPHDAQLALLSERQSQFGDAYVSSLIASVPEPTSLFAACALALPLLSRRRRTR